MPNCLFQLKKKKSHEKIQIYFQLKKKITMGRYQCNTANVNFPA